MQSPAGHMMGRGCKKCGVRSSRQKIKVDMNAFKLKASVIHGNKYDYSNINIENMHSKIKLTCPIHKIEFLKTAAEHIYYKRGCPVCGDSSSILNRTKTTEEFIEQAKRIHNNKYGYLKTKYYNATKNITVTCPTHGDYFVTPDNHISKMCGCPTCKQSKGERLIESILHQMNVLYIKQHSFDDCRGRVKPLKFDFFLPSKRIAIEFDGEQHFRPVTFGRISKQKSLFNFRQIKEYDRIKNNYCSRNNIQLIRLSNKDNKNLSKIICDKLQQEI